jgi:hypothetical protein
VITLTADKKMLALLAQVKELGEVRDANGNVVGFFAPLSLPHGQEYAKAAAQIDPAEMQRRKKDKRPGHTTKEVLKRFSSDSSRLAQ